MAFRYFLRRASSSITIPTMRSIRSLRPHQGVFYVPDVENRSLGRVIVVQFPTFVRFFTAPVHQTASPNEVAEEINIKAAERSSTKSTYDGLNELPFEIKDGGLEEGYITLKRKYKDEIIEIKVRPYYNVTTYYSDSETDISTDDDDEEEEQGDETDDSDHEVVQQVEAGTEGNNEVEKGERYHCQVEEALKLLAVAEKNGVFKDKLDWKDKGDFEHLYVLVKIHFGVDYKECVKFYLVVYPDKFHIRSMSRRVAKGTEHLQDYEKLFKQRVFQDPSKIKLALVEDINFLFNCHDFIGCEKRN